MVTVVINSVDLWFYVCVAVGSWLNCLFCVIVLCWWVVLIVLCAL